jgi:hypothetical protein
VNCPGVQENNQDINSQKYEGIKIKAEIKLNPCLTNGLHAAFEGGTLGRTGIRGNDFKKSKGDREEKGGNGKKDSDYQKQTNIAIVCQQLSSSLALARAVASISHLVLKKQGRL